jgi:pimeloyl-ACP methyl ester carboxylesterase
MGREARASRRALRHLAISLAAAGFVTLRFDFHGTGDSGGNLSDSNLNQSWLDSVAAASSYLRNLGLTSISTIGMRLGATVVGVAGATRDLGFASTVLWDPCESGRSFLRELTTLESLRREGFEIDPEGPIETSEIIFTRQSAEDLRKLSLIEANPGPLAQRVLVLTREDRMISNKLRLRLDQEKIEWETTLEQRAMLDIEPLDAVMPTHTMDRIVRWLSEPMSELEAIEAPNVVRAAVVAHDEGKFAVNERFVQLGSRDLFGIISEPSGPQVGPWIVLLNVANEEHTGPARLWVDLSRRWAGFGLRCVRFDLTGLGDSPWLPGQPDIAMYDPRWLQDVPDVVRVLSPQDPSDTVFIGLCSGAYLAVEAALTLHSKGVCAINPPVNTDFLHGMARLEKSRREYLRALALQLKQAAMRLRWIASATWEVCRLVLPSSYTVDIMAQVVDDGTNLLVLASTDDLSPFPRIPLLRSLDNRRVAKPRNYQAQFVTGLDHSMQNADGRALVTQLIDRHILENFANVPPQSSPGSISSEDS